MCRRTILVRLACVSFALIAGISLAYVSDNVGPPSADQPVGSQLASIVENAAASAGLNVHIKSTNQAANCAKAVSNHCQVHAYDIDRVNGKRVGDPRNVQKVDGLHYAMQAIPGIPGNSGSLLNLTAFRFGVIQSEVKAQSAVASAGSKVNSNSTNRAAGCAEAPSNHCHKNAVDINKIDGMRVDDPRNLEKVERLQQEMQLDPRIRENYGPVLNLKTLRSGLVQSKAHVRSIVEGHRDHVHVSAN